VIRRRRKSGKVVYYARVYYKGRAFKKSAGTKLGKAVALAEKLKAEIEENPDAWIPPRERKRLERNHVGPTYEEFEREFLRDYARDKPSEHYPQTLAALRPWLGGERLRDITPDKLRRAFADMRSKVTAKGTRLSDSTIRKRMIAMQTFFKIAVEQGVVPANPMAGLKRPAEPPPRTVFLEREEFDRLLAALPNPIYRDMAILFTQTGARRREVLRMQWPDVNLALGAVWLRRTKTGGGDWVPLTETAKACLRRQDERVKALERFQKKARAEYVWVDEEGKDFATTAREHVVSRAFRRAQLRAGITKGRPTHILRHTAASWVVQRGGSLYEAQRLLGHTTPNMTQRYAHLLHDHLKGAMAALELQDEPNNPHSRAAE
jgi:integrase